MAIIVRPSAQMWTRKASDPRRKASGRVLVLVTVTVLGSAGPLRFLVDEGDSVAAVVRAALRCYAREGRIPMLRSDIDGFLLYCANGRSDALEPDERISFNGCRSFVLCKKPTLESAANAASEPSAAPSFAAGIPIKKGSSGWKAALNRLLVSFRV